MADILLDSSIIIDHLRQKDKDKTILTLLGNQKAKLSTSIIAHTESYSGKRVWESDNAMKALKTLFLGIQVLELNEAISEKAGKIRAEYGTSISDATIAATALEHKSTLATLNVKDFKNIKGLKLFKS